MAAAAEGLPRPSKGPGGLVGFLSDSVDATLSFAKPATGTGSFGFGGSPLSWGGPSTNSTIDKLASLEKERQVNSGLMLPPKSSEQVWGRSDASLLSPAPSTKEVTASPATPAGTSISLNELFAAASSQGGRLGDAMPSTDAGGRLTGDVAEPPADMHATSPPPPPSPPAPVEAGAVPHQLAHPHMPHPVPPPLHPAAYQQYMQQYAHLAHHTQLAGGAVPPMDPMLAYYAQYTQAMGHLPPDALSSHAALLQAAAVAPALGSPPPNMQAAYESARVRINRTPRKKTPGMQGLVPAAVMRRSAKKK